MDRLYYTNMLKLRSRLCKAC